MIINSYQDLNELLEQGMEEVYIAGAGNYGRILGDYLNKKNYPWNGFVDKLKRDRLCGKPIYPFTYLENKDIDYIFISTTTHTQEIYNELIGMGIEKKKIITFFSSDLLLDIMIEMEDLKPTLDGIGNFKNKYLGKRCFVIGNGPSLTEMDLNRIKNEVTFASNSIYAIYEHTIWRPTYYGICDIIATRKVFSDEIRQKVIENSKSLFCALSHWDFLHKYVENTKTLYFFKDVSLSNYRKEDMRFSNDASDKIYTSSTITYVLIQLAVYMGFQSIYLLGVDFTFSTEEKANGEIIINDVVNHNEYIEKEEAGFYEEVSNLTGYHYLATTDYQLWGYQLARKYADSHGIKIYNATRGGKLEVFERVDFDSLF